MKKKLSVQEIESIISKIRIRYNDLIVTYLLSPKIKKDFEDRLYQVRRAGVNPERFLGDEINNIRTIEQSEKDKLNKIALKERKKASENNKTDNRDKKDFADRIIEKMMEKIAKYPEIYIHENANPEIRKLFGTLIDFDSKYWGNYDRISKKYRAIKYNLSYMRLENSINEFSRIYKDDVPTRLLRYKSLLSSPFARTKDIEKEEKMAILEAAVLVNDLRNALSELDSSEDMPEQDSLDISDMIKHLDEINKDFRLKDLMELKR